MKTTENFLEGTITNVAGIWQLKWQLHVKDKRDLKDFISNGSNVELSRKIAAVVEEFYAENVDEPSPQKIVTSVHHFGKLISVAVRQ